MKALEKVFDIIAEILAVLLVIVYVVAITNSTFHYLDSIPWLYNIVEVLRTYGSLALVAIVGLEAMSKRSFVLRLIFYILIAVIVVFMFFPGTYEHLIGMIPVA